MQFANRLLFIALVCPGFAGPIQGQAAMEPHEQFVCSAGSIIKVVSIYQKAAANTQHARTSCRVDYTKEGKTTTLWSSTADRSFCTSKALALVTKLMQDHYSCMPEAVGLPAESETSKK